MLLTGPEAKKELLELERMMEVEARVGGAMRWMVMEFEVKAGGGIRWGRVMVFLGGGEMIGMGSGYIDCERRQR